MIDHIAISPDTMSSFCPKCKAIVIDRLGLLSIEAAATASFSPNEEDSEYAELGLQAVRAFIQGCNAKTRLALQHIVSAGDTFSLRDLENQMNAEPGTLRGIWSGLTKRTRTITGDPDAALIEWSEPTEAGDYTGRFNPTTREAFRRALAE